MTAFINSHWILLRMFCIKNLFSKILCLQYYFYEVSLLFKRYLRRYCLVLVQKTRYCLVLVQKTHSQCSCRFTFNSFLKFIYQKTKQFYNVAIIYSALITRSTTISHCHVKKCGIVPFAFSIMENMNILSTLLSHCRLAAKLLCLLFLDQH